MTDEQMSRLVEQTVEWMNDRGGALSKADGVEYLKAVRDELDYLIDADG